MGPEELVRACLGERRERDGLDAPVSQPPFDAGAFPLDALWTETVVIRDANRERVEAGGENPSREDRRGE